MLIEIAYGLLGLALVALCHLYDFFPLKDWKVVDETQNHPSFTSDVNTLHQTNDLLPKSQCFNG